MASEAPAKDLAGFKAHQLARPDRQPITVQDELRRLRMVQRELDALDPPRSLSTLTAREARDILGAMRERGCSTAQFNNRAKAINSWLQYRDGLDEDDTPIRLLPVEQSEYRALDEAEFAAVRAWLHAYAPGERRVCPACRPSAPAAMTLPHRYADECPACHRRMALACRTCGHHPRRHFDALERVAAAFCVGVGIRPEEVSRLDDHDYEPPVRDEAGAVTRLGRLNIRHPAKRGNRRRIPIPTWVCDVVDEYRAHRPRATTPSARSALIRIAWRGRVGRANPATLTRAAQRLAKMAGVALTFIVGRHTVATRLLTQGVDIRYVQYYLGHKNIRNTAIYAEVRFEDVETRLRSIFKVDPADNPDPMES